MKDLNQVERIKIKLNLAKNTDSFFEVFGADSHKYRLDAPINIKEVEIFEKNYNISLPDGYKVFLTQIGNGGNEYNSVTGNSGTGPDYGIFKLGHKYHFMANPTSNYLEKPPFFNSKTTKEDWDKISENMPENIHDDEYVKELGRVYTGIFAIGFCGCCGFNGIMLSGEDTGRIVHITDEIEYCPQFAKEANFLDWYENWLDSIISGQRFKSGGPYGTEEEHFARYANVENVYKHDLVQYWKIVALRYIKGFDSLSHEYMEKLWENYYIETDKTVNLYILNLLVKFDYENAKTELEKLYKSNALEFLKILHLYAKEKTSDWQNIIQKLQNETLSTEVTEYIKYVIANDCSK
ncbi:MAG: SMI1/KNR4 family protein [Methanobacteriaceae archaeon]|jgi:hypothetical protein|nr:SMI1/KNR4 family protein [Candidatus Methanorudis spinitermitis]